MAGKNGAAASYLIFRVEESKVYLQKMLTFHLKRTIILQRENGRNSMRQSPGVC